jgi:hypothetical protein
MVPQFAIKKLLPQLFQAAEVMVFHIPASLVQFRGNLRKRVAVDKE